MKGEIEGKVGLAGRPRDPRFGLFAFVFLMVLREGAETVLTLAALSLNSTALLSFLGTLAGSDRRHPIWRDLRQGQRAHQPTEVLPRHHGNSCSLWQPSSLFPACMSFPRTECSRRPNRRWLLSGPIVRNDMFFFVTILALAALMVLFEMKRRQPASLPDSPAAAAQGACGARGASACGWDRGLLQFVSIHRAGDCGVRLHQERERAFPGHRGLVCEWASQYSAGAGFGWRSAPLPGQRERDRSALLALSEAGRKSCDRIRCLRDLRSGGLLQRTERRGLQELRRAHQWAVGGHQGRMQSRAAARRNKPQPQLSSGKPTLWPDAHWFQK